STDGSLERLRAAQPAAQVITNQQNLGVARAANQAVAAATGTWLLLANLDVELERDYIARLVAAGNRDPRIGSVTGKLLRPRIAGSDGIGDPTGQAPVRTLPPGNPP